MEDRIICPHHHYEFLFPDGTCRNARRCGNLVIETLEVRDGHCYIRVDALNRVVRGH
jgi:nitrite reductase/ring-hydroxylating ferredoxin subunit